MKQILGNHHRSAQLWAALAAIAFIACTLAIPGVHAADRYWDNNGCTANDWGSAANWSDVVGGGGTGTLPGTSDVASFSATPIQGIAQTVNLNANRSVQGLNVLSGVSATTTLLGGGANRTLTNGVVGIVNAGSSALTIGSGTSGQNVTLTLAGSQRIAANGSGGIAIVNTVAGIGSPTLTNNGTGTGFVNMGAVQATVGKIVQNSATSTLGLRANNSGFGGNVEILKGKVLIGTSANNLGSTAGQVILGGSGTDAATLKINDNQNITYVAKPIVLGSTLGLLKIVLRDEGGGSFTHTITGTVTGNNHLTIENQADGGNMYDKLTFTTGGLNNAGTITHIGTGSGDLTINSVIGANVTGVIQNSATSKLVLTGNNTYSADTTISAGTLALTGSGAIGNSANILLAGGATFNVSGLTSQFTLGNAQTLKATGSASAGTIAMVAGKGVAMGATSRLQFTTYNGSQAPLTVSGTGGSLIRSAEQRFFKSEAVLPTTVFDAKTYGAVGNGLADDTAAVQATINAARQHGNGAIAYFPDGNYKLTSTINITGTNYYVGGAGGSYFNAGSVFTWGGNSVGPIFLVADPQNVTMQNMGIWVQGKPASLVSIRQVSNTTQPSRMHYEQVSIFSPTRPGLSASPADLEVVGLAEDSVLTGSGLFARAYWDGRHLFDNCSSSRILLNEVNGNIGVKGTQADRDGFLGTQVHQGTFVIEDNHSIVASDSYLEQGPQEYARLRGAAWLPEGRVTISSPRLHTREDRNVGWQDDFIIEDYRGTLASVMARSDSASEPQAVYRYVHTGSGPFNIVCLANSYADAPPIFDTAPEVSRTVLGCWVRGSTSYSIHNVTHTNSLPLASGALDHFRELGQHDLEINYGIVLPRHTVTYEANGATSGTAPASQNKVEDVTLLLANNSGNLGRTGHLFAGWNTTADGTGTNYAVGGTYTNNAAMTLYAKWTVPPAGTVTETFDTAATTAANGWAGSGNTGNGNDFGWTGTGNVLGSGGEVGGIFARSAAYRTFADTNIGTLGRTNTLRMLGSFKLNNADFDGGFRLGYFKTGDIPNNFLGITISEPASSAGNPFRGYAGVGGTGGASSAVINLAQGTTLTFDLTWTGNANGSGTLSGTLAGQSVNVSVGTGAGTFDVFGLACGGFGDASTENTGGCYFDSLTYTTALTWPTLNATHQGNQIQIGWTPAGGTLETSPVLGPAAVWTTVGTNNPVPLEINDSNSFFRVVIP
jgi:hypothetical protein